MVLREGAAYRAEIDSVFMALRNCALVISPAELVASRPRYARIARSLRL